MDKEEDRQKRKWEDSFTEWTRIDYASSSRAAEDRARLKGYIYVKRGFQGKTLEYHVEPRTTAKLT